MNLAKKLGVMNLANCADYRATIEEMVSRPELVVEKLQAPQAQWALVGVLRAIEKGVLRVSSPKGLGAYSGDAEGNLVVDEARQLRGDLREWEVHSWVKHAVLLALRWRVSKKVGTTLMPQGVVLGAEAFESISGGANFPPEQGRVHGGALQYFDKLDARSDLGELGVRVVPPGVVREGAYVAPGCIIMPGYVNIGAFVDQGTMVDTWATVGSCAQVGRNVHLAGGVGIGGVLEPAGARPVMIGDNAFIGSRAIVVEGAVVGEGAVLGANVCITASTPIYDVTSSEKKEHKGFVPANAVVAPGTRAKSFPGGEVQLQCSYIIGWRSTKTDAKVSLNDALRESGISI